MTPLEITLAATLAFVWILGGWSTHLMGCALGHAVRHKAIRTRIGQYTVYALWPFILLWVVVTVGHGPSRH